MSKHEMKLRIPYNFIEEGVTLDEYGYGFVQKCKDDFPLYPSTAGVRILDSEVNQELLSDHFKYLLRRFQSSGEPQQLVFGLMATEAKQGFVCDATVKREGDYIELTWNLEEVE